MFERICFPPVKWGKHKGEKSIPKRYLFVTGRRDISSCTSSTSPWRPFIASPGAPVIYMPSAINLDGSSKRPVVVVLFFPSSIVCPLFRHPAVQNKRSERSQLLLSRAIVLPALGGFCSEAKRILPLFPQPPRGTVHHRRHPLLAHLFTLRLRVPWQFVRVQRVIKARPLHRALYIYCVLFFFRVKGTSERKEIREGEITKGEREIIAQGGFLSSSRISAIIDPWLL